MFKGYLLERYQKKLNRLKPPVNISLNKEIPIPSCRDIAGLSRLVSLVNSLEPQMRKLSDAELKEKTQEFKRRIEEERKRILPATERGKVYEKEKGVLDDILPEVFAVVREAARRTINMRHFDVQILGGIVLHQGKIAEMATGEGKTLVATLPAYLNALMGKGVHIVTVNDYLAKRDRDWMGPIYEFLGLKVGVIYHGMSQEERKQAYLCDITYGTNNEFGFDYLRDNMVISLEDCVQRGHFYAIVDEVDSILIDEARTPLIISGPSEESVEKYYLADKVARQLKVKRIIESHQTQDGLLLLKESEGKQSKVERSFLEDNFDAIVEEKNHNAYLTKRGEERCESILGIKSLWEEKPDRVSEPWVHYISQSLRAHYLFEKDVHYIVKEGKVIIVDEFTGRLMPGRRWSDGLHQAVEAKERLKIERENQTLATITLQNYFRMYDKLAGMTGTAYTEAQEFKQIYNLETVVIPTNRPLKRSNFPDVIYKTRKEKFQAVVEEIEEFYKAGRPVLVGTTSIENSEVLSQMLKRRNIKHQVLNAKYHEMEAYIVAQAGRLKSVTIATNMAGRGTDILLGGNPEYLAKLELRRKDVPPESPQYPQLFQELYQKFKEITDREHQQVVELGGLHVIGTERHEARRIDNQLRGRAGRQGDPGSSRFYVSLEDDLMRLFASDRLSLIMDRLGWKEGECIEHPWITKSIEIAQRRVEAHNFEIRKQLLEYDNVMNRQREVIYSKRRKILESQGLKEETLEILEDILREKAEQFMPASVDPQERDKLGFVSWIKFQWGVDIPQDILNEDSLSLTEKVISLCKRYYEEKRQNLGEGKFRFLEKMFYLQAIDSRWKEHLYAIDYLKEGIFLRAYAQRDPLVEFQHEAFNNFQEMLRRIEYSFIEYVFRYHPLPAEEEFASILESSSQEYVHQEYSAVQSKKNQYIPPQPSPGSKVVVEGGTYRRQGKKIGRNDPCPCGSGKKYKHCCGRR